MTPRRRNILVGAVVLGSLVALAWLILKFSNTAASSLFTKGTHVKLVSARVDGVSEGSPLTYLGVPVGRVLEVRRQANNAGVEIVAVLDTQQALPKNVEGRIRQQSALGNSAAISLETPGAPSAEPLADGATIPTTYAGGGMIPPEFGELAAEAREQRLVQHLDEMIVSVRTQMGKVGKLLEAFDDVAGDQKVRDNVRAMVANLQQTTERLNQFSGTLNDLSAETKATLGQVRTTVADTGAEASKVSKDLGERLTQIGQVLDQFQAVAAKVNKGEGTAGQLVNDPRLYESMVDASKELNETIKTLKRLADQWEHDGISVKGFR